MSFYFQIFNKLYKNKEFFEFLPGRWICLKYKGKVWDDAYTYIRSDFWRFVAWISCYVPKKDTNWTDTNILDDKENLVFKMFPKK